MFNYEKFDLTFSLPAVFFFIALIILVSYAYYVYRYTIPAVNPAKRYFLVSLRTLALLFLLFIYFEPILTLAKKVVFEPKNLIFIDNSKSILIDDGTNRKQHIEKFLIDVGEKDLIKNSTVYSFGSKVNQVYKDSLSQFNFNEGSTNFSKIFSSVKNDNQNISSIVIVSDGDINEGENPLFTAEKIEYPGITIGVGDTARRNDIEIKNVLYNEYIYNETPTTILAAISNSGFSGNNINISLFENSNLIERKNVTLSEDGIQNVNFEYTPKVSGEKKLTVVVNNQEGEFTHANNKKVFYINVLSNKIKILILAGAPSPDLSFIKNTLESDKNLTVKSITQISQDKFLERNNRDELIDSADIFFLISFPSRQTSNDLLNKVKSEISQKDKPFFFILSEGTDITKLNALQKELGFTAGSPTQNYNEVQPYISGTELNNPLIQNNSQNILEAWNNLPPVFQLNTKLTAKPECEVVSNIKEKNVPLNTPLILTRKDWEEKVNICIGERHLEMEIADIG